MKRTLKIGLAVAAFAMVLALGLQVVVVPTSSMEGTVLVGDHLLIDRLAYGPQVPFTHVRLPRLRRVRRGDVVSFHPPGRENEVYLKRVVAIGGDRVESRGGELRVNGERVGAHAKALDLVLPAGEVFVLGDNRGHSEDSRMFGTVPERNVIGEPVVVLWSFSFPSQRWLTSQAAVYFDHPLERLRWARMFKRVE